ncbi:hypothetical protein BGX24_005430 [Mortierella sp. AD032]|nr:hypothetical protein BGX24_005430 [Mortierella sp. AD032]
MIVLSLKTLLFTTSVVSLATVPTAALPVSASLESEPLPTSLLIPLPSLVNDACGILGTTAVSRLTYEEVAACYRSVPFNKRSAATTLESVITIMNEFYVFRDSALTPDLAEPFSVDPVDILKSLETIGRREYESDHQFHHDLSMALVSLKDAHASYSAYCFKVYYFSQPLALYAPVVNGKQVIQVHTDHLNQGYAGCTVQTIDGEDALAHIIKWADTSMEFSKDAGVRLNHALTTLKYSKRSKGFKPSRLPDRGYIDYGLLRPGSTNDTTLRGMWSVSREFPIKFNSLQTFVQNICEVPQPPGSLQEQKSFQPQEYPLIPQVKESPKLQVKSIVDDDDDDEDDIDPVTLPVGPMKTATLVGPSSQTSVIFQLNERLDVGILHVRTHSIKGDELKELDSIVANLVALNEKGVRNIIIDFQGNFGGDISFASALAQLFFPNKNDFDKSLASNLRVTDSIQDLTTALFNTTMGKIYDAATFYNFDTKRSYTNNGLFINTTTSVRNGRTAQYTEMTTLKSTFFLANRTLIALPWTHNATNIRILTDGRCGSSCLLSTFFLTKSNKVLSYAVGGITGKPLSTSSFTGGAVTTLSAVHDLYSMAKVASPFKPLPYNVDV